MKSRNYSKQKKDHYDKKYLASTGFGFEDMKGNQFSTKLEAQISTFFIHVKGRFMHGFPFVIKHWWAAATAIWPFILIRKDSVTTKTINHEMIHIKQQVELYMVGVPVSLVLDYLFKVPLSVAIPIFLLPYTLYLFELLIRVCVYCGNVKKAYYRHSMETEAAMNAENVQYVLIRKKFAWLKYIFYAYDK
jgi:hypothetical protein